MIATTAAMFQIGSGTIPTRRNCASWWTVRRPGSRLLLLRRRRRARLPARAGLQSWRSSARLLTAGVAAKRRRSEEGKKLNITAELRDRLVKAGQATAAEEEEGLPHWKVEPWDTKVDGATLLDDIEQL